MTGLESFLQIPGTFFHPNMPGFAIFTGFSSYSLKKCPRGLGRFPSFSHILAFKLASFLRELQSFLRDISILSLKCAGLFHI